VTFIPPKTFSVGEVLSAIDMNTFVRDNTSNLDERLTEISSPLSYRYVGQRIITETTTVVFDDLFGNGIDTSFVRALYVRAVGGGGGGAGGGTTSRVGGGGGSGAYTEFFTTFLGAWQPNILVTIGQGGAGGAAGSSGSNGTSTTLPSELASLGGGNGGSISVISQSVDMRSGSGGLGGIVATATVTSIPPNFSRIRLRGNNGGTGISVITSSDAQGLKLGGEGANSPFGQGGLAGRGKTTAVNGSFGQGFGSGGGGGGDDTATGGDGMPGVVILDLFR